MKSMKKCAMKISFSAGKERTSHTILISFTLINLEIDLVAFDANELSFPEGVDLVLFQNVLH